MNGQPVKAVRSSTIKANASMAEIIHRDQEINASRWPAPCDKQSCGCHSRRGTGTTA